MIKINKIKQENNNINNRIKKMKVTEEIKIIFRRGMQNKT